MLWVRSKRRKALLSIALALTIAVVGLLIFRKAILGFAIFRIYFPLKVYCEPWLECPINLPDGSGQIVFTKKHIHPFLAEYKRKIRFETTSIKKKIAPLGLDPGAANAMNVYWHDESNGEGPYLRIQDKKYDHVIDLKNGIVLFANYGRKTRAKWGKAEGPGKYLGRINSSQYPLRFISAEKFPEEKIMMRWEEYELDKQRR